MAKAVFIGAHVGFPGTMPLGGGAVIGDRLIREWAPLLGKELLVLGAGPRPPAPGIQYRRIPAGELCEPQRLSVGAYARFCREFAREAAARVAEEGAGRPAVFLNDISEAPSADAVAPHASRLISLWHVDVADYIGRVTLKSESAARRAPGAYERLRGWGLAKALPSILGLIFEKQRAIVLRSDALVLPSQEMGKRLLVSYGKFVPGLAERIWVLPWGYWEEPAADIAAEAAAVSRELALAPDAFSLLTLSRLSPEKGIDILLEALARLEKQRAPMPPDTRLLVCGDPAFMWGEAYLRALRAGAGRLKKIKVHFLGHVQGARKKAVLSLASLFAPPSLHESYGLAIQEGLKAGLPVLASDSFGAREILRDGCGVFARYTKRSAAPAALAQALRPLLADPALLEPMRVKVRASSFGRPFSETAREILRLGLPA